MVVDAWLWVPCSALGFLGQVAASSVLVGYVPHFGMDVPPLPSVAVVVGLQ